MVLCILSDSHDNELAVKLAVRKIQSFEPEMVVHCGDIVSQATLELFRDLPISFVLGNCDSKVTLTQAASKLGFPPIDSCLEFSLQEKSCFASHGNNYSLFEHVITSQSFDYVFHGHTHLMEDERIGKTRVICPGALHAANPLSFAVLNLDTDQLEFVEINI